MRKLTLLCFLTSMIVFGSQQESETRTMSRAPNAGFITFESRQPETFEPVHEADLRAASAKALKLIQKSQSVWYQKQTCTSCHHQLLPEIPISLARQRGIDIDETIARDSTASAFAYLKDLDAMVQGYDYIDVIADGWGLVAAHAAGIKPSLTTAAEAQFVASRQLSDGSWPTMDGRPPQSASRFTTTAVCARALRLYLPEQFKGELETRVRLAREWLLRTRPLTTEDRTYQLLGLGWTGADQNARQNAARQLLAEQRSDGGWSQIRGLASDAYATGEALVALKEGAGISTADPAYQRGLRFLLGAQEPDGSWLLKSRLHPPAPVSPPFANVGFPPFQHDQFISIMGTTWAADAMLHAIAPQTGKEPKPSTAPNLAPAEQAPWMRAVLTGSRADLKKLLDAGMNPNEKTGEGTTALMLAARNVEKARLLIERGADVNARSAMGITPLMVTARYRGNSEVVRLLLKKGAGPNAEKGVEVRNDASALFFAVMAGDVQTAGALLDAGARLDLQMKILGNIVTTPANYAVNLGDSVMVDYLISRGADSNELDGDGISLLGWASIANRLNVVQTLLARGARLNTLDKYGMTPLLYAASIDFGDTAVLEKLIGAGADLGAKNKEGLTALDLARNYKHEAMANLLAQKTAAR